MNHDKKWQMTTMALSSLGLLALASAPGHAAIKGETIVIQGHDIDVCAEDYGPAWQETADSKPGDIHCECVATDDFSCDSGTDHDSPDLGGGLDDWEYPDAGGWTPPEGEECTAEDPEVAACGYETCESCKEDYDECVDEGSKQAATCESKNRKTATATCQILKPRGLTEEQCIEYELTGTPGFSVGSADTKGSTVGGNTGFSVGFLDTFKWNVGGNYSRSDLHTNSFTTNYPHKPVDRRYYEDCESLGREAALTCVADEGLCFEDAESEGETCES